MVETKTLLTKRNFTDLTNKKNLYIVIHYVGAVSSAYNNAKYFDTVYRGASAHNFVDEKDIYQVVREGDAAWHCGAKYYKHLKCRNSNSIGIEMCCYRKADGTIDVSEKVIERTIELTKELMAKYDIPVENVIRHYDVTGKACPKPLVNESARWSDFISRLSDKHEEKEFKAGERVVVDVPVEVAFEQGDMLLIDDGASQFWIHKSVVENGNRLHALATVCYAGGDNYIVQVFDNQFWCKEENMAYA